MARETLPGVSPESFRGRGDALALVDRANEVPLAPADPRRELLVELDLAQVGAEALTGRAARGILRGELHDDARRTPAESLGIGDRHPIALAHLPGADRCQRRLRDPFAIEVA